MEGGRRWKGGGGGGGGAILGTGLLVAGGPVEGSPWVSGVEAMEEEAEEDEGVDEGLAGGHEEVKIFEVRITQPPLRGGQRIGWLLPVRLGLLSPRPVYEGEPLDGIHELIQLGPGHARIRHDPAQVIALEVEGRGVLEEPFLGGHLVLLVLAQVLKVGEAAVALGRVGVRTTRLVQHPPGLDPHLVHVREKVEEQGVHVRRGQGDSPYDQRRDEGADEPGVWAGVEGGGGGGRGGVRVGEGGGGEDPADGANAFRLHPLQLLHTSHTSRMYI